MPDILTPTRRAFIATAIGVLAAPMVVRASSIMPVRAMALQREEWGRITFYRDWKTYELVAVSMPRRDGGREWLDYPLTSGVTIAEFRARAGWA